MKKFLIPFFLLSLTPFILKAQSPDTLQKSKNNLYFEFGTSLIVSSISLNYERHFFTSESEKINLYARGGYAGAAVFWGHVGWGGLGALTLLTGKGKHHFETSGGLFVGNEKSTDAMGGKGTLFSIPVLDLGYRYQKPGKSFIFRAKVGTLNFGLGLGYAF